MDPRQVLEAKKAKILDDARKAAAEIDRDLSLIEQAKQIADKYGFDFVEKGKPINGMAKISSALAPVKSRRDPNSPSQLSQRYCEELIRERGHPVSIHDLKEFLTRKGVEIGGIKPIGTLSAYLSSNKAIASMRKGWWGLKEWEGTDLAHGGHAIRFDEAVKEFPTDDDLWG
ncbi:MAG: hypothetical protein AB7U61_10995 [Methylocystis sp.]